MAQKWPKSTFLWFSKWPKNTLFSKMAQKWPKMTSTMAQIVLL